MSGPFGARFRSRVSRRAHTRFPCPTISGRQLVWSPSYRLADLLGFLGGSIVPLPLSVQHGAGKSHEIYFVYHPHDGVPPFLVWCLAILHVGARRIGEHGVAVS